MMDLFYWVLGGGPEIVLSAIFVVVALPLALFVTAIKKIKGDGD